MRCLCGLSCYCRGITRLARTTPEAGAGAGDGSSRRWTTEEAVHEPTRAASGRCALRSRAEAVRGALEPVVDVVQKEDQPTGKKTRGIVARHLTRAAQHPRGIKVLSLDGARGRVVAVLETLGVSDDDLAAFARVSNPQRGRGGGRGRRRRGGGGGDEVPRARRVFTG